MKKILFVLFIFLVALLCYAQEQGISKQNNVRDIFGSVYRAGIDQTFSVADSGSIFLMRKGEKISETVSVNNEAKIHLPYDLPSGDYYLENVLGEKVVEFQVEGISPQVPKREVNIKEISLIFPNKIKAGKTINAELIISFAGETFSEKLILIFEKSKDVAYFGTAVSFDRDKKSVSVDIPETMPKGEYTVYYMTDKDVAENMGSVKVNVESTYTEKNTPLKPIAYGFFKDTSGAVQIWYTNQAFTLYWAGEPMYKTSGMLNGDYMTVDRDGDWDRFVKNIDSLEAHGIKHVYLYTQTAMRQRPLYKWETIMDYLETRGFTYTIGNPVGNWDLYKKEMKGWIVRANPANMKFEKNVKNGHTS
ncbi:MAG: hypothetical protein KBT47_04060, partial [Armatimonadetes bacterium]|nr:hypothetical protein [Candidatus Hippobium faecium]